MHKRLSDKISKVFLVGVMASTFTFTPQANAIGTAEPVHAANHPTQEIANSPFMQFNGGFTVSFQPSKKDSLNFSTLLVQRALVQKQQEKTIEEEKIQLQKQKAEREAKVQEERATFIKMVEKHDIKYIDLKTPSGLTSDDIEKILKGTRLAGLGEAFAKAEQDYGVNAYYLIAHAAWESGWGESKLAKTKNNLFGFSAYDDSAYSSASSFKTKSECIDTVAKFISEQYLNENGDHYNGPNLKGMNKRYASDKNWAQGIADTISCLVQKSQTTQAL